MIFTIYIYIYIYTLRSPTYIIGSSLPIYIYIYYTPGSGIQVHEMLNILAKNPVFASNPACLADFVKSLVATSAQAIPTPMHKPAGEPDPTPTTPSAAAAPAMAVQHNTGGRDEVESSKAVEARKQFWSKFKRPSSSSSQDAGLSPRSEALLSLPTLRLGEEVPDEKESIEVIGSQELTPQMAEPVVPHCGPIPDTVLPDSQAASPCMANAVVHLEDPEPASEGPGKDGEPKMVNQSTQRLCRRNLPAAPDLSLLLRRTLAKMVKQSTQRLCRWNLLTAPHLNLLSLQWNRWHPCPIPSLTP